jgi:sugar O-acyltransferase (sialic acid O-acetyltransferase NeuD family)
MSKVPIILIGGGGHCISCIDVIEQTGIYTILGILDVAEKVGQTILNYQIIGTDDEIEKYIKECSNFLITVGQIKSAATRISIFNKIKKIGGKLPVIVSPLSYVSIYSKIEEGTIIMHHALVNANASIGKCCIINTKALIEHEAEIGHFCHISTSSCVNGQATIKERCFIGSNTIIANNKSIISDTIVSAGSQVLIDLTLSGTYIGNPLKRIN